MKTNLTPFSALSDEEFIRHLLNKKDPTPEDVEAALRLQLMMEHNQSFLEDVHRAASKAMATPPDSITRIEALARIRELTAPEPPVAKVVVGHLVSTCKMLLFIGVLSVAAAAFNWEAGLTQAAELTADVAEFVHPDDGDESELSEWQ